MKFAIKLSVLFSVILVVFGIVIASFVYTQNLKILEKEIIHGLEDEALHTMSKIDRTLYERYADIQMIASDSIINSRNSSPEKITERLIEYRNIYKTYSSLSFFDLNRIRIADTSGLDIGKQYPIEWYWEDLLEGKISAGSVINISKTLGAPVIFFASPVKDKNRETFGYVVSRVPVTKLYEITKESAEIHEWEKGRMIDLVDKNGLLLYSNYNRQGILKDYPAEWEFFQRLRAEEKIGSIVHPHADGEMIHTFIHEQGYLDFKGNDWTLVIDIPTKIAFAPAIELRNKLIAISLLIIAFAVLIVLIFSRTITKSIIELHKGSEIIAISLLIIAFAVLIVLIFSRTITKSIIELHKGSEIIARGNLNYKTNIKTKDEIGQLSRAFDQMTSDLKESHEKLKKYAHGLEEEVKKRTKDLDIELKEAEESKKATMNIMEDLNETLEKLKELDKMKLAFLSSISHELRTPLTPIRVQLQRLLTKDLDKKEQQEVLDMILRNSVRLDRLISDLLAVNRIQSGRLMIAKKTALLSDVARDAVENQNILAKEKNINIINKIPSLSVPIDRDRILEIFINLINNGIKYSDKGQIALEAKQQKDNILVSVKDQGKGISKENIDKLFTIFYQVEPGQVSGSSGIGLFICKGIIEAHGGKIWANSEPGKGSAFYFTIPLKEQKKKKKKKR